MRTFLSGWCIAAGAWQTVCPLGALDRLIIVVTGGYHKPLCIQKISGRSSALDILPGAQVPRQRAALSGRGYLGIKP
jgi:hypothetical protein